MGQDNREKESFRYSGDGTLKNGNHVVAIERYWSGKRYESRICVILSDDFSGIGDKGGGASPVGMKLLRELDTALRQALNMVDDAGINERRMGTGMSPRMNAGPKEEKP